MRVPRVNTERMPRKVRFIKADDFTIKVLSTCGIGKVVDFSGRLSLKDKIAALATYFEKIHERGALPLKAVGKIADSLLTYAKESGIDQKTLVEILLSSCDPIALKRNFERWGYNPPPVLNDASEYFKIKPYWILARKKK